MPPQVQILENVLKRLEKSDKPAIGMVYGIIYEGKTLIVGYGFESISGEDNFTLYKFIDTSFSRGSVPSSDVPHLIYPTGIDFCGIITIRSQCTATDVNSEIISSQVKALLKEVQVTNNPVYLSKNLETNVVEAYYLQNENIIEAKYEELSYSEFHDKFVYVRLKCDIKPPLQMFAQDGDESIFQTLGDRIADGLIYRIVPSAQYIYRYNSYANENTIRNICDRSIKFKDVANNFEVINIEPLFPNSSSLQEEIPLCPPAPIFYEYSCTEGMTEEKALKGGQISGDVTLTLPFDGLCIVQRDKTFDEFYSLLTDATERIINIIKHFLYFFDNFKGFTTNHYFHEELGHPLTILSLSQGQDSQEIETRKKLHQILNLSLERPYFRKANRLNFISSDTSPPALINVHEGIRPASSRKSNIKQALVYGKYAYYHYMMGGKNDQGWGCAYRSLQTLCSWFKLQGYTENEIPNHEEIQRALVDIGDKEPKFIGSRQWIGSTEVGFFLESKWDISSRIQYVSSGSEMDTLTEMLLEHFTVNGTPIMIGGGVLAHTIVGVQFYEDSGETFFLVLDPHYTGADDLSTIQKKGYIGWKGVSFWDQKAFYNLLLPQRKICF